VKWYASARILAVSKAFYLKDGSGGMMAGFYVWNWRWLSQSLSKDNGKTSSGIGL
jgi:hypothetical protein